MSTQDPFATTTEFNNQAFKRLVYRGKIIEGKEFEQCTFAKCSFVETAFLGCRMRECTFKDCDLRLMRVKGSTFVNVKFEGSEVTHVNWTEAIWPGASLFDSLKFQECSISYSTFIGLALRNFGAVKCTAKDADFAEADLTRAVFTGTDFAESRFLHTNLSEADFTGAVNYTISPLDNPIKKAKFSLPAAVSLLIALGVVIEE